MGAAEYGGLHAERLYPDGTEPRLGDVIEIAFAKPVAHSYQQENHLVVPGKGWKKTGAASWGDLDSAVDDVRLPLWHDGEHSRHGLNDRIPESEVFGCALASSLLLIEVSDVVFEVGFEGADYGRPHRTVRARFAYKGSKYKLAVTDPEVESHLEARPEGYSKVVRLARLCLSISEPFRGNCYKFVAGVIVP